MPGLENGTDTSHTKILLVDDNPGDRRLVIELLKLLDDRDFTVVEATTLEDARAMLPDSAADVVFLDLALPDGTGVYNVETIRAADPDVTILVLSGSEDERMTESVLAAGATAFLSKMDLSDEMLRDALEQVAAKS